MRASADPGAPPGRRPLLRLAATLLGAASGWLAASSLPPVPSAVLVSLVLAGGASQVGTLPLSPPRFWLLIGVAAGGLVGTAAALAERAHQIPAAAHEQTRLQFLLVLALAGALAGMLLGRDAARADRRHPRDLLRSASALTTGLFAFVVTLTFLHQGLEGARAFSSRLSTTLTIVVTAVAVPGWLSQQLLRLPVGGALRAGMKR